MIPQIFVFLAALFLFITQNRDQAPRHNQRPTTGDHRPGSDSHNRWNHGRNNHNPRTNPRGDTRRDNRGRNQDNNSRYFDLDNRRRNQPSHNYMFDLDLDTDSDDDVAQINTDSDNDDDFSMDLFGRPNNNRNRFTQHGPLNRNFGRQLNILNHNLQGVYHLHSDARVPQNRGWSCGFHCLYNAKTIDTTLGIRNISDNAYINAIQNQIRNPQGASTNVETSRLARTLGLNLYNLHFNDNRRVVPLFDEGTQYSYYHGESRQQAYQRAFRNQETAMWTRIRNHLNRNGAQTTHFVCNIMSGDEPHVILVSAVKDTNGRYSLYVFDNMNNREPQQARNEMVQHIRYVHQHIFG